MPSFFQQLKQRRIVQIVASYAVSGWVATEVVGALVERGLLPELAYRLVFVLFLGGLAASVVMGWYHGEKGEQKATPVEMVLLTLIALGTVYSGFGVVRAHRAAAQAELALAEGSLDLRRVAVLYFRDRSRSGDLGYLADGLTESLIERLGRVGGVTVVSTAGSAQVRDSELPLDSIGSLLSAGLLVDGFVERAGDDVRVTVTLVDGDGGAELRRATVRRPAEDVLELDEELTEEVAGLLRGALGTEIALRDSRAGTSNTQAWATFLRGQRLRRDAENVRRGGDFDGFLAALGTADSLFAAAAGMDQGWAQPVIYRALVASRLGGLWSGEDPARARTHMEEALRHVDLALVLDPRSALGHQVRGTIQYRRWALGLAGGPAESRLVFDEAVESLEQATALDPALAQAWNTLSVLYSQIPDNVQAKLAATRALEADQFLLEAEDVLVRLYATSYDLEQFRDAIRYCDEGKRRFPANPTFTECRLWLMAAPLALDPDAAEAWRLVEEHLELLPEAARERARIQDQLVVAAVLARAQLPDSARAVIARSQAPQSLDPELELLGVEALAHLALGDPATAVARLQVYLTASPEHRSGWRWSSHWWWRPLQGDPGFRRLIGG